MHFSKEERKDIARLLKKTATMRRHNPRMRIMGFPALLRLCAPDERKLLKQFLRLNPRSYGFKGVRYRGSVPPRDLVLIRREHVPGTKRYFSSGRHFLPQRAHEAYGKMNNAMFLDIGRKVFVLSGYRSPAYQLVVFLETLEENEFDMKSTVKRVALPGCSEHGVPKRQAIDFTTFKLGKNSTDDPAFERTKEYRWLLKRAGEFGFYLSYPRGNKQGVMFEPWHWHYCANARVPSR